VDKLQFELEIRHRLGAGCFALPVRGLGRFARSPCPSSLPRKARSRPFFQSFGSSLRGTPTSLWLLRTPLVLVCGRQHAVQLCKHLISCGLNRRGIRDNYEIHHITTILCRHADKERFGPDIILIDTHLEAAAGADNLVRVLFQRPNRRDPSAILVVVGAAAVGMPVYRSNRFADAVAPRAPPPLMKQPNLLKLPELLAADPL
jgi:hypothetical protein